MPSRSSQAVSRRNFLLGVAAGTICAVATDAKGAPHNNLNKWGRQYTLGICSVRKGIKIGCLP